MLEYANWIDYSANLNEINCTERSLFVTDFSSWVLWTKMFSTFIEFIYENRNLPWKFKVIVFSSIFGSHKYISYEFYFRG